MSADAKANAPVKTGRLRQSIVSIVEGNEDIGPQKTLYVPASLLRKGKNEIIIFESDAVKGETEVEFCAVPCLGK